MRRRVGEMSPARDANRAGGAGGAACHIVRIPYIYHKDEYTNNTKLRPKRAPAFAFSRSQTGPNYIHMRATGQWHMARVA